MDGMQTEGVMISASYCEIKKGNLEICTRNLNTDSLSFISVECNTVGIGILFFHLWPPPIGEITITEV